MFASAFFGKGVSSKSMGSTRCYGELVIEAISNWAEDR